MLEIPLRKSDKVTTIDEQDYDLIKDYKWRLITPVGSKTHYATADAYKTKSNTFYPSGNGKLNKDDKKTSVTIHRIILDHPKNKVVNHLDGNGLNNCRSNLEVCSQHENILHSVKYYKGEIKSPRSSVKEAITFSLDNEVHDEIKRITNEHGVSRSKLIRFIIKDFLKNRKEN